MTIRTKRRIQTVLKHVVLILLSLAVIIPFYLVLVNSLKTKGEAARISLALPTEWHFENYRDVIEKGRLIQGFFNSLLYSTVSAGVAVLLAAMGSFVINRRRSKRFNNIYYFIICGLFLPVNYVTLLKVLDMTHLSNGRVGLIITFLSSMIPFSIFVIRSFVSTIPVDIDEAAIIDGAGPLQLFFIVIVPLLQPILVTAFILQFMGIWSDFITPLYLTSKSSMWPMNLAVYNFFGKYTSEWNLIFADIVLTTLPVIIVYLLGQRYILQGITAGSVKG